MAKKKRGRQNEKTPATGAASREAPKDNSNSIAVALEQIQEFSGPTPPPEIVERYEAVQPGSWDRILTMAEKGQAHQHEMERKAMAANSFVARGEVWISLAGLLFAFLLAGGGIFGGVQLMLAGYTWQSVSAFVAGLTPLIGTFIIERRQRRSESKRK